MDDYNVSVLSEAKNEYSLRLVTILYPLVLEGIKSILKEAWELCLTNDEEEKYLMTFQNFLSRVTKWNQTIIEEETARILAKSGCPLFRRFINMCSYYSIENSYEHTCKSKTKKNRAGYT